MKTFLSQNQRSYYCGELRETHIDETIVLCGWVENRRDHGGCIFIDLRDRSGISQIVFDPKFAGEFFNNAKDLRSEHCIGIQGKVISRGENINPRLPTGKIEIVCEKLEVFSSAETPPFVIEDNTDSNEALRLKYRFLDLRRPIMQEIFKTRSEVSHKVRNFLGENNFLEIETPFLIKGTPEGARDFLVPSRIHPGEFYALPQSPQIFKQLFMVSGFDRYYQIVRCFRDEDLRANRQPEFTQIDVEMSFVEKEQVMGISEEMVRQIFGDKFPEKVPVISYQEAIDKYGTDAPDIRFGLELSNITDICKKIDFQVFRNVAESGGMIKCILVPGGEKLSRKDLDSWNEKARKLGAGGLAWVKFKEDGWQSPIAKFFSDESKEAVKERTGASTGDLLFFCADKAKIVHGVLSQIRIELGHSLELIDKDEIKPVWITEFPLFEKDEDGNLASCHHPFTCPSPEDIEKLESDPASVKSEAYDLVVNGQELGGGSIRIHDQDVQMKIFKLLGLSEEEAREKFGFLLDGLKYGTPPHGGIAFGLDRIIMILTGRDSIRDVIAFPKTQKGTCLMMDAPAAPGKDQLKELSIKVDLES